MIKIYVPDIECESCTRLISRKFKDANISDFKFDDRSVILLNESKKDQALHAIKSLGYRADLQPFERKTFAERLRSIKENPQKYATELKGLNYGFGAVMLILVLFLISYFTFLKAIPNFLPKYGIWLIYLIISVISISMALWHFLSYRARVTCMAGMMIGMMFGMQSGMMIGAVLGATNGFFVGATAGMLIGVLIGALTGKCCGVMGVMQGMMAGVMGGTMGPMISIMMIYDNLHYFMPLYMIINLIITFGLIYLFYEEVVEKSNEVQKKHLGFMTFAAICVFATILLSVLIIYGPKSYAVGG